MLDEALVGRDIRASEPVDGLLRIAYHEELARLEPRILPALRGLAGLLRQIHQQLALQRVRVLELVDQEGVILALELLAHLPVPTDQVAGRQEQSIERDQPAPSVALLEALRERSEQLDRGSDQRLALGRASLA